MRYAEMAESNLPIASGMVEAACKTLATQRMNRSASQGNSHPHPACRHPDRRATKTQRHRR